MSYFYLQNQSYHGQIVGIVNRRTQTAGVCCCVAPTATRNTTGGLPQHPGHSPWELSLPDQSSLRHTTLTGRGVGGRGGGKKAKKGTKTNIRAIQPICSSSTGRAAPRDETHCETLSTAVGFRFLFSFLNTKQKQKVWGGESRKEVTPSVLFYVPLRQAELQNRVS